MKRSAFLLAGVLLAVGCSVEDTQPPIPTLSDGPVTPYNVRLSFNDDPSSTVAVIWQTDGEVEGAGVEYGAGSSYGKFAAATRSFTIENEPALDGIVFHEATLTGLKPGSVVHYRVGSKSGVSENFTVATAPASEETPVSFVLLGDSRSDTLGIGAGYPELNAQLMKEAPLPSFILDSGDYTMASLANEWVDWLEAGSELGPVLPRLTTFGNHEMSGKLYYSLMNLPDENSESWYSLRYGELQIICLDTGLSGEKVTEQKAWLEEVLKDSDAKWKVAFFHKPPYNAGNHTHDDTRVKVRTHWVPLFEQYGVDLVVSGHDHNYQRFGHVKDDARAAAGTAPFYLISGGAGAPMYGEDPDSEDYPLIEKFEKTEHYVLATLEGNTLTLEAKRLDGTIFDTVTITK